MRFSFETELGWITVGEEGGRITEIGFRNCGKYETNPTLLTAKLQLEEYLAGERTVFDLPLMFKGTDFQKRIWKFLLTVPYGKTATYADAARAVGCPKGARAAGGAIGANPIAIVVPCHRIIGSNGKMTGYEYGVEIKQKLLELERKREE